jgi:hypothetical protein
MTVAAKSLKGTGLASEDRSQCGIFYREFTFLGHGYKLFNYSYLQLAEREGFEPSVGFPLHTLSKRAPSTTRTSLRFRINELRAV